MSSRPAALPVFILTIACFTVLLSVSTTLPIPFSNILSFFLKILYDPLLKVCNVIFPTHLHLFSWLLPLIVEGILLINFQDSMLFLLPKYNCISKHFLSQNSFLWLDTILIFALPFLFYFVTIILCTTPFQK